jgi:hypothetical protein
MTHVGSSLKKDALRQSGGHDHIMKYDFRSMTLCHQVSLILPFGSRSILTTILTVVLDAWLCVAVFWRLCFLGSLAVLTQFSFRPMTLRRRVSPALLFLGADLIIARQS